MTRQVGKETYSTVVTVTMRRPGSFRLESSGGMANTVVAVDKGVRMAYQPDRKVYSRSRHAGQLMGTDPLAGAGIAAPASRVLTMLLCGASRDQQSDIAGRILKGEVLPPQPFGSRLAHVLRFDYSADYSARAYVSVDTYRLLRVALYAKGQPIVVETLQDEEFEPSLPDALFRVDTPPEAREVAALPPLQTPDAPLEITLACADGTTVTLDGCKGKVLLLVIVDTADQASADVIADVASGYEARKAKGLVAVAVAQTGETNEKLTAWATMNGVPFGVAANKVHTDVVRMFSARRAPTMVLFDRDGRATAKITGYDDTGAQRLKRALEGLGVG